MIGEIARDIVGTGPHICTWLISTWTERYNLPWPPSSQELTQKHLNKDISLIRTVYYLPKVSRIDDSPVYVHIAANDIK